MRGERLGEKFIQQNAAGKLEGDRKVKWCFRIVAQRVEVQGKAEQVAAGFLFSISSTGKSEDKLFYFISIKWKM